MGLITWITSGVTVVFGAMMLYQVALCVAAFGNPKKKGTPNRTHRFALVISARNEEKVIGHLLDTLFAQNYPRDAFDVFVIADNCTDRTGDVAREKGASVYDRHNLVEIGKGFALTWFFDQVPLQNSYDAIGIFDADNLVEENFLSEMNYQLCMGQVAVMGNRDSKNPHDSWVSGCMSLSFWNLSRFYSLPRTRLGLSAVVSGTGYVFKSELIPHGWQTSTICEDTEFSMQVIAAGHRVAYAPDARFYDEQPVKFQTSARQRRRWAVGCYQNVRLCVPMLAKAMKGKQIPLVLDAVCFLLMMPMTCLNLIVCLFNLVSILLTPVTQWHEVLPPVLLSTAIGYAGTVGQGLLVLILEKKLTLEITRSLLLYPFFIITTGLIYLFAVAAPQVGWQSIEHKCGMTLGQVEKKKRVRVRS